MARRTTIDITPIKKEQKVSPKKGNKPNVSAGIGGVGVSQGVGNSSGVNAGVSNSGNVNAGVGTQVNEDLSLNAGVSSAGGGNVGVGANYRPNSEVGVNVGVGTGGVGVTTTLGSSDAAAAGATAGGAVGTAFFGPVGGAVGSAAGSAGAQGARDIYKGEGSGYGSALVAANPYLAAGAWAAGKVKDSFFGGNSKASKEGDRRDALVGNYVNNNLFGDKGVMTLPDGSTADFNDQAEHDWYDSKRRVDKEGDRQLFGFEADYTNDADFISSMLGTNYSRITGGGSSKEIDQVGQLVGNKMLGKVGYGAALTEENFSSIVGNHRAMYAQAGIDSKEEYLGLANQMFGDGRLDDTQYAGMLQGADILYDGDYNKATALMAGRWKGIATASATPSNPGGEQPAGESREWVKSNKLQGGGAYAARNTMVTAEEAMNSVMPFFEGYKQIRGQMGPALGGGSGSGSTASNIIQALVSGVGGVKAIEKITGYGIKDIYQLIAEQFSSSESGSATDAVGSTEDGSYMQPDGTNTSDDAGAGWFDMIGGGQTDMTPSEQYSTPTGFGESNAPDEQYSIPTGFDNSSSDDSFYSLFD